MRKDIYERMKLMFKEEMQPNYAEIARRYNCDYRTVKRYYEAGSTAKAPKRTYKSKLDNYKEIIIQKLDLGCTFKSIYCFIKGKGFEGKYTILRDFCATHRAEEIRKATIRFETCPGLQAQVDWKESVRMISKSGEVVEINIFLMLLGYSRMKYIQLTIDKTQDTLFDCMLNGLKYFNGVPKEIIFDNMRTVVNQSRTNYQEAVLNESFYQFSKDMGFEVWTCRAYRPQTKGKVEALAKLMSRLEPYNYEFDTVEELAKIVREVNSEINSETSQATGQIPFNRWKKEKEYLLQLPNQDVLNGYLQVPITRTVSKESMVTYKYNKYSLDPKYIGKTVTLEVQGSKLTILLDNIVLATHEISERKLNYRLEDCVNILKTDAFRFKSDDEINDYAKKQLALYDVI